LGTKVENMVGQRFGLLAVIQELEPLTKVWRGKIHKRRRYYCKCDCGGDAIVEQSNLRTGNSTSCGCEGSRTTIGERSTTHGHASRREKSPEYQIWWAMQQRCDNPKNQDFANYGGRGVTVCIDWRIFENFYADMGPRPSSKHSIDRWPNNDGNYEPTNCRWATAKQQANNKRIYKNARIVEYRGERMCLAKAARLAGVNRKTAERRLNRGLSVNEALA
jgi:hypothetical protein